MLFVFIVFIAIYCSLLIYEKEVEAFINRLKIALKYVFKGNKFVESEEEKQRRFDSGAKAGNELYRR